MLLTLAVAVQIGLVLSSAVLDKRYEGAPCEDAEPLVCKPNRWPPWWGMRGPIPCNTRRYTLMLYQKCRKTCDFCGRVVPSKPAPCNTEPCLNGATCVDKGPNYKCICPPAFSGNNCQTRHTCSAAGYTPEYYLNLCYKMYTDNPKTYSEAQSTCQSDGGQLVAIKGYHVYNLFRELLKTDQFEENTPSSGYWTDGKERDDGDMYFSDGERIFGYYTGIDPDRDSQTSPVCMSLFWDNRLTGQAKRSCESTRQNFICSMPTTQA